MADHAVKPTDRGPRTARGRRSGALVMVVVLVAVVLSGCASSDDRTGVSLILKTQTNPYFIAMKQAAQAEADKKNVRLSVAAGTQDGDTQNQIGEIYTAIARGDKGILITSNGNAVNAALRQAKEAGLFVIALDTPLAPTNTADITFATDNEAAGKAIGKLAATKLDGKAAVIAMLDLYNDQVVAVDTNRDHGFLEGMGIDPGDKSQNAQEKRKGNYTAGKGGSYTVACHQPTQGAIDGGRTAMEQCLSANPDINVVYSINEPAGQGAYAALQAAGKTKQAMVVTIDGSCSGMDLVKNGVFAADSTQYPGKMAQLGVDAISTIATGGARPTDTAGKDYFDTGTALVTATPVSGLTTQTVAKAKTLCWGSTS